MASSRSERPESPLISVYNGTARGHSTRELLRRPRRLHHYTTMEFVVAVLREIFHKSESDAVAIMLNVHRNGFGVAGVYTFEVAETKINKTHALAKESEFPLKLTMEPEEL